jgi:Predicted glycosyltransferases
MYNKFNLPSVAIIVLNWNGKEDTLECLASLKNIDYGNFQIIVVDNGSEDGSVTTISKHFPEVILLENCANLGYAGGNNTGIKWAIDHNIDNILILNNDTIVAPNILTAFLNAADVLPDESVLGAKIYYYDKPDTIWFAGGQWINYSKGFIHLGSDQIDSPEFNSPNNVDYITGCALFASAKNL